MQKYGIIAQAFGLAVTQLRDRKILWIITKSLLVTLVLMAAGIGIFYVALSYLPQVRGGEFVTYLIIGALAFLGWLLFRTVAMMVMGLFADAVVDAVENQHYPDKAARAMPPGWRTGVRLSLLSLGRAIGYNLLALPVYVVLLVSGIGTFLAVIAVNGLALGKDAEAMVAARHPEGAMEPLSRTLRNLLGIGIAALFMLPFFQIFAPVIGAAMAVHVLHLQNGARLR